MKKTLFLTIIFFLYSLCNLLHAQQWQYHNPALWYDVNAVEIPSPGVIAIGGGWETNDSVQIMFQTSNYGLTWTENTHDGLAPWNKSIAFSDDLNGYAVGYNGRIIKTDDAGRNWGWATYPTNRNLNKIFYAGAGTYYVAGGNKTNDSIQTILKSTDHGDTWNVIYDTLGPWLKSIYFTDTLKGFTVGDNGVILSTTDGGNNWISIAPPLIRDFNAITFVNSDTGFIIGGTNTGFQTLLRTNNAGLTWNIVFDSQGGKLNDISFADFFNAYIVGDSATVLKTIDGGTTWIPQIIDTLLTGNEELRAVSYYDTNFCVIGGKAGTIYIYTNIPTPEIHSLNATLTLTGQSSLLAQINTHGHLAQYTFYYSTDSSFSSSLSMPPQNIVTNNIQSVSTLTDVLSQNMKYYYYLKLENINGVVCSDTLSFLSNSTFFYTQSATDVTCISAQLNGQINNFPDPVYLFFEYGLSSNLFTDEVQAIPAFINDSNNYSVYTFLTALENDTTYYFRLKGITATDTIYSIVMSFFTTTLPVINVLTVSEITFNSAKLNAIVGANGTSTTVKFQYGTTSNYEFEVNAVPSTVNGVIYNLVFASLNNLLPDTNYHYRVKATNASGTVYSSDKVFYTGYSEIPNFSFEIWDTLSTVVPDSFDLMMGVITKYSPGCNTTYAVKLESEPLAKNPGVILIGEASDPNNFSGGAPFNARPDTLMGCFNYNIAQNDTALILLMLKKQGVYLANNMFKIFGSSNGDYNVLKFPIEYNSSEMPDSIIFGISSSDFRSMLYIDSGSYLIVDNIRFSGTNLTIPNFDFENWIMYERLIPNNWSNEKSQFVIIPNPNAITQTTDAQSGQFALFMQNVVTIDDSSGAQIVSGNNYMNVPSFKVNNKHQYFTGYYKFFPQNDTLSINIYFYKNGQIIGFGSLLNSEIVNQYTPFIIEINYYDTLFPDSATILIRTFYNFRPKGNSILYIDNLNFDGFLSGVKDPPLLKAAENFNFNIFPNPISEKATVSFSLNEDENVLIRLFDLSGKQVALLANGKYHAGTHKLDFSSQGLQKGFYICIINTEKAVYSKKIIVL